MGALSRLNIVTRGLNLAGQTGLGAEAPFWLNMWLADVYDSWYWPFLYSRYVNIVVPQLAPSLVIGPAGTIVTDKVTKFRRAVLADVSNQGFKNELDITSGDTVSNLDEPSWLDSTTPGTPTRMLVEHHATDNDSWNVYFAPIPDKAYRMNLVLQRHPAEIDVTSAGDTVRPVYPNDMTMVQCLYAFGLSHQDDEREPMAWARLDSLLRQDRTKYGEMVGYSSRLMLNPRLFKTRNKSSMGWPWPGGP